jgi:hypothetical protein
MRRFSTDIWAHAAFDPGTLTAVSVGGSLLSGGMSIFGASKAEEAGEAAQQGAMISAQGTLAAGDAALEAGRLQKASYDFEAEQDTDNAAQSFAAGQRQALATQDKTRLAISSARAVAGGNGTNVAVGSPSAIVGDIARRGSYAAATDMFNGESAATGLRNKAAGERFSGEAALFGGQQQQAASRIAAQATLAGGEAARDSATGNMLANIGNAFGSFGNAAKSYGTWAYPSVRSS